MPANVMEFVQGRQNRNMVELLEKNHDLSAFILACVDHVVEYANRHGVSASEVMVDRPFVEHYGSGDGEYIRARLTHRRF